MRACTYVCCGLVCLVRIAVASARFAALPPPVCRFVVLPFQASLPPALANDRALGALADVQGARFKAGCVGLCTYLFCGQGFGGG